MRTLATIALSLLSLTTVTHAELRVRLRVNSENIRARTLVEGTFRDVIGNIPDIIIDNASPSVDEILIVNAVVPTENSLAFSTVLLDMDSYLMAARDTVREISIDELKKKLQERQVSGTVSYATVSTCGSSDIHESVRSVINDINKTSFQDLRTAILKYGALSTLPKLPEETQPNISQDTRPPIGQ
jgi:SOS response regulatory protein OraA/RecX